MIWGWGHKTDIKDCIYHPINLDDIYRVIKDLSKKIKINRFVLIRQIRHIYTVPGRKLERALLAIAINRIIPPSKVYPPAVSPRKSHTQNGPKTTSVMESSANSADGTVFEPKVYKISPAPTWKTPKAKAIKMSRFGTSSPYPLI